MSLPLEHPIPIETREDAEAFYAFPEMLFFVAVSRALSTRKPKPAAVKSDEQLLGNAKAA